MRPKVKVTSSYVKDLIGSILLKAFAGSLAYVALPYGPGIFGLVHQDLSHSLDAYWPRVPTERILDYSIMCDMRNNTETSLYLGCVYVEVAVYVSTGEANYYQINS